MNQFRAARRAGVPLVAIESSDPAATIKACVKALNGKADTVPVIQWDAVRGPVPLNEPGRDTMRDEEIDPAQCLNPTEFLSLLITKSLPEKNKLRDAIIFMHMANRLVDEFGPCQAIWLARDAFKAQHITLVMLGPSITLPAELKQDVILISEPLPDAEELQRIAASVIEDSGLEKAKVQAETQVPFIVDTLRGLSAFSAEQVTAMCLGRDGINRDELIKLKRSYISQLPGIEVREDKITFADIAGYENVKTLLRRKIDGKRPPRLVIWWDEFDRSIAGNASDTSGTTQDQVGVLLQFLQDRLNEDRLSAMILVGVPGAGKSAVASAVRNEANCECLRWDMGGMKDSLVGSSEKRIRAALKVVDAMSAGHILVIATANSLKGVPSPVISRFALGCYYFPLPTPEEGAAIWKLKRAKYNIPDKQANPTDQPLVGREIHQCCFIADDLQIPLAEALKYITPYYATNKTEIEMLNDMAHKRWLSASEPGFYVKPTANAQAQGRKMEV